MPKRLSILSLFALLPVLLSGLLFLAVAGMWVYTNATKALLSLADSSKDRGLVQASFSSGGFSLFYVGEQSNTLDSPSTRYAPDRVNVLWILAIGWGSRSGIAMYSASASYWLMLPVTLVLPCIWFHRRQKEKLLNHRRTQGLCLKCGYDLRASEGRCPECGDAIPVQKVAQ